MTRLFEASRDGSPYSLPEGTDIISLGISFFCAADGAANLHIGGMRSRQGTPDFIAQLNDLISPGSVLTIRYLRSHPAPEPLDARLMQELGERLWRDIKGSSQRWEWYKKNRALNPPRPAAPRSRAFRVELDGSSRIIVAELRDSAHLSASVDWHPARCGLSVHSVRVLPGGQTEGEEFLATELVPGQELKLTLLD